MKQSRVQLKMMARRALRGNYTLPVVGMLVFTLLSGVMFTAIYFITVVSLIMADYTMVPMILAGIFGTAVYLVIYVVMLLLSCGYLRLCYNLCIYGKADFSDMLYAFRNHPLRFLGAMVMIWLMSAAVMIPGAVIMFLAGLSRSSAGLFLVLAAMILIYVPTFIVALRYGMTVMIMIENPECRVFDALRQSLYLTRGKVGYLFVMGLSFLGWIILGMLSGGIGYLWIYPYTTCTMIFCYQSLKQEKYNMSNQM